MVNARASVSLVDAAHQRGVTGRTHAPLGLRARLRVVSVPQVVHEASVGVDTTARQRRSQGLACIQPVSSRCPRISSGVRPSRYPQDAHWS
jgi:hypothetical protein